MAGWRAALQAPARQLGVERQEGIGSHVCRRLQALVQTEHQQRGPAAETGLHHACADLGHLIDGERARKLAREFVEIVGAALALTRDSGLEMQVRGEVADEQAHAQHHAEGEDVLHVAHSERKARRHVEEIEGQHVDHRRQCRGPAAEAQRHRDHAEHEQHDGVRQVEVAAQRAGQQGDGARDQQRGQVAPHQCIGRRQSGMQPGQGRGRRTRVAGDEDEVEIGRLPRQHRRGRAPQHPAPPGPARGAAEHDAVEVVGSGIGQRGLGGVGTGQHGGLRTQVAGALQQREGMVALRLAGALQRGGLHRDDVPARMQRVGQAGGGAHQADVVARARAHQQGLGRVPHGTAHAAAAVVAHLAFDLLGGEPQRELAQRQQIAFAKEIAHGVRGLFGEIDLAVLEALQQVVGRQIDQHHFIGPLEDAVGQGFAHLHAGDAADDVAHALEVLDVQRGVEVDAGVQQFLHVLPAFGMSAARCVAVRQFVDQQHGGATCQRRGWIELAQQVRAVTHLAQWNLLQPFQQPGRLGAAVGFDQADADVHALVAQAARGHKHGVGLADTGRGAKKELEPTALRLLGVLLDLGQQRIGRGANVGIGQGVRVTRRVAAACRRGPGSIPAHSPEVCQTGQASAGAPARRSAPAPGPAADAAPAPRAPPDTGPRPARCRDRARWPTR